MGKCILNRKFVLIGCMAALSALVISGCKKPAGHDSSDTGGSTKTVQVSNVDGNKITATVGELADMSDIKMRERPSGAPDRKKGAADGTVGINGSPDGNNSNGNNSNGDDNGDGDGVASGDGGKSASDKRDKNAAFAPFTAGDEEIMFTVTDDTEITVESMGGRGEKFEGASNKTTEDKTTDDKTTEDGTIEDITENSILEVTLDGDNNALTIVIKGMQGRFGKAGGGNGNFGGSSEVTNGTAKTVISEEKTVSGGSYPSDGDDENALRIDGAKVILDGISVDKSGGSSSDTENGDFYGQNAGLLALNGANVTIKGGTFSTDAVNGNAVFSYGEGTNVDISDAKIRTSQNNSGGIQTTGGGTTKATNLDVETQGNSSAAIRSDRGGGTVSVNRGKYVTNGTGSPVIYSTADISVSNAALTSNASEGVVVEGKNSVSLKDCDVTGNMKNTADGDNDENIHCIMLYQSMSGDADVGNSSFSAEGGSITARTGDFIYVTNTQSTIFLKNVKCTLANNTFLRVEGNSSSRGWGTQGSNGGDVTMSASKQTINGNIITDKISTLKLTLSDSSKFTGAINSDGEAGTVEVVLENDSTWTLTGDSCISSFSGDVTKIKANGNHLYVNGKEML